MSNVTKQHFAIGLTVHIDSRAVPAGMDPADREDFHREGQSVGTIHNVNVSKDVDTYEVFGWWWLPQDLTVVG